MANANYRENTHFSSIFFLQKQIESNYNRILINISGGTVAYHMVNHLLVVLSWLSARISCHPWHQLSFFRSSEICPLQLKVMVSLSLKTSALVCSQRYDMNRDIKREMWKSLTHTIVWRGKKITHVELAFQLWFMLSNEGRTVVFFRISHTLSKCRETTAHRDTETLKN